MKTPPDSKEVLRTLVSLWAAHLDEKILGHTNFPLHLENLTQIDYTLLDMALGHAIQTADQQNSEYEISNVLASECTMDEATWIAEFLFTYENQHPPFPKE